MSVFWKNIAPDEWKLHGVPRVKKKKIFDKYICSNPFHYLYKHCDLSHSKPTPCVCSNIPKRTDKFTVMDIRQFFIPQVDIARNSRHINQDDLIRGAHDREKNHTS